MFNSRQIATLPALQTVVESVERAGVAFDVFDRVRIEPSDASMRDAIEFAKAGQFDSYIAVGGGSVMDTAKVANLYSTVPQHEFLDFVNAPVGKGLPVPGPIKPLIAIATTSGTGSETTGTAIFDYKPKKFKTGISNRNIRPTLGLVDPLHTITMPRNVVAYSGFDVLCHAIESYTAIPYSERQPRPAHPAERPAYQGQNPISDIWSLHALRIVAKYLKRSLADSSDTEARSMMHLAGTYAGVGFGNAGCHLCHGMSYPISGNVRSFKAAGYDTDHPIIVRNACN